MAINADPQMADKTKSSKMLFKDFDLIRDYILFLGVGISTVSTGFI